MQAGFSPTRNAVFNQQPRGDVVTTTLQPSRLFFAACLIALGITGLVNGDFALVWQHVPAHVPGRTILAYICAVIEVAFGIGLLWQRTLAWTCSLLFPYMVLWLVLLQVPGVIGAPLDAGAWGSVGEIAIITAGAWCLLAVGLCNSIMFPTIFALTLERSGAPAAATSGLLVLAVGPGAALPLIAGGVADTAGLGWAFAVPALAYLYVAGFAWAARRPPISSG